MKKIILSIIAIATALTAAAQINGSGYYRVQNYGSGRYIYVCDGYSKGIDVNSTTADMGAIQLWKDLDKAITDPASVIYADQVSGNQQLGKWDLKAQGTGVYDLIGYYVEVEEKSRDKNLYMVSATMGVTVYLFDANESNKDKGSLTTDQGSNRTPSYSRWQIWPINQDNNYVAVAPSVDANGKHYAPYYAGFPFSTYSTGMKTYTVSKIDYKKNIVVIKEAKGIIPAGTPVIVECSSTDKVNNKLQLEDYKSHRTPLSGNILKGVYFSNDERPTSTAYVEYDSKTMRILSVNKEGKLAYITATEAMLHNCGTTKKPKYALLANQSYLPVSEEAAAELVVMTEEEYAANTDVLCESITLSNSTVALYPGDETTLTATVLPANATNKEIEWKSSNTSVATVDQNGKVTAIAIGEATITATTKDETNLSASCTVTVNPVLVSAINISKTEVSLTNGESVQLYATVEPENAHNKALEWTSSNDAIATVTNQGLVTMVTEGTALITVKTTDGSNLSATCSVNCIIDGIEDILGGDKEGTFFTIDGRKLNEPQHGINIFKTTNGKTFKVLK